MREKYVLFLDLKSISVAKVAGAKDDKVTVFVKTQKTKSINKSRIICEFESDIHTAEEVFSRIEEKSLAADIATLYELLEPGREYPVALLGELLFENEDSLNIASAYYALKINSIYFKEKNKNFIPEISSEVERKLFDEKKKEDKDEQKKNEYFSALEWIADNHPEYRQALPDSVLNIFKPLKYYAIHGDEYHDVKYAKKLLREIKKRTMDAEIAADALSSFNLCVKAGIFKESENLAIHRYNIISSFRDEELEEALELKNKNFDEARCDFTDLKTFTIDDETTFDFDDAISFEKTQEGYNLYVHIADAAHYVEMESSLDKRASKLGMSVYMPSGTVSMFPKVLSEEAISLKKGSRKCCITFLTRLDEDFNIISKDIYEGIISVDANLTYEDVDKNIEEGDDYFKCLCKISDKLFKDRLKNNAIEFVNPDIKVLVKDDNITIRRRSGLSASSLIVKELMILTGYQAASYCLVNNIPCIYITQDEPTEDVKLKSRIIEDRVLLYSIVKKMKRSNLMVSPFRHYALGLECYTQCTSPIRRYHDLIIQRQIKSSLKGEEPPYSKEQITEVSATSESYKRNLGAAQKEEKNYWLLKYIQQHKDEKYTAIVLAENRGDYKIYLEDFDILNKVYSYKRLKPSQRIDVSVKNVVPRASILNFKCT